MSDLITPQKVSEGLMADAFEMVIMSEYSIELEQADIMLRKYAENFNGLPSSMLFPKETIEIIRHKALAIRNRDAKTFKTNHDILKQLVIDATHEYKKQMELIESG
jgi:hypothetical protein